MLCGMGRPDPNVVRTAFLALAAFAFAGGLASLATLWIVDALDLGDRLEAAAVIADLS